MIYIFWANWDGASVSEFEEKDKHEAEKLLVKIRNKELSDCNGERLIKVVQGSELFPKEVEKVSKIELSEEKI